MHRIWEASGKMERKKTHRLRTTVGNRTAYYTNAAVIPGWVARGEHRELY